MLSYSRVTGITLSEFALITLLSTARRPTRTWNICSVFRRNFANVFQVEPSLLSTVLYNVGVQSLRLALSLFVFHRPDMHIILDRRFQCLYYQTARLSNQRIYFHPLHPSLLSVRLTSARTYSPSLHGAMHQLPIQLLSASR